MTKKKDLSRSDYVWLERNILPEGYAISDSEAYSAKNKKNLAVIIQTIMTQDNVGALDKLLALGYHDDIHQREGFLASNVFSHKALKCFTNLLSENSRYSVQPKFFDKHDLLIRAVETNSLDMVKILVNKSPSGFRKDYVLPTGSQKGVGAIHFALSQQNVEIFRYFFEEGFPIPFFKQPNPTGQNNFFSMISWFQDEHKKEQCWDIMLQHLSIHTIDTFQNMYDNANRPWSSIMTPKYQEKFDNMKILLEQKRLNEQLREAEDKNKLTHLTISSQFAVSLSKQPFKL